MCDHVPDAVWGLRCSREGYRAARAGRRVLARITNATAKPSSTGVRIDLVIWVTSAGSNRGAEHEVPLSLQRYDGLRLTTRAPLAHPSTLGTVRFGGFRSVCVLLADCLSWRFSSEHLVVLVALRLIGRLAARRLYGVIALGELALIVDRIVVGRLTRLIRHHTLAHGCSSSRANGAF